VCSKIVASAERERERIACVSVAVFRNHPCTQSWYSPLCSAAESISSRNAVDGRLVGMNNGVERAHWTHGWGKIDMVDLQLGTYEILLVIKVPKLLADYFNFTYSNSTNPIQSVPNQWPLFFWGAAADDLQTM